MPAPGSVTGPSDPRRLTVALVPLAPGASSRSTGASGLSTVEASTSSPGTVTRWAGALPGTTRSAPAGVKPRTAPSCTQADTCPPVARTCTAIDRCAAATASSVTDRLPWG
ncbi:MAG: hypothetical protein B7X40_05775, partial [Cellulomonas sp. 14-74-6]